MINIAHMLAFQIVWAACVLGAANGAGWMGPAAALVLIAVSLAASARRKAELLVICQVALLGAVLDSLLTACGVLTFAAPAPVEWLAPPWIVALWAAFATLGPRSLSWLQSRLLLAALLGALAGPVTYLSAARLDAAQLLVPLPLAIAAVSLEYAIAMPIVMALSAVDGNPFRPTPVAAEELDETSSRGEVP